ncbi:MAG: hypothetical protein R3E86_10440 [Pseudomonadales bacterium]
MPIDLREQATENLRFIRNAMERAERISAVSGAGAMAMGGIGLAASALAAPHAELTLQLQVWMGAALAALIVGGLSTWHKTKRTGATPFGDAGRRFVLCLTPALLVGAMLTTTLWSTPQIVLLPASWMMLYGAGTLAAGTYAVPPVMKMGAAFLVAGSVSHLLPDAWCNVLLGVTFGGFHIAFGWQVYRHHGG